MQRNYHTVLIKCISWHRGVNIDKSLDLEGNANEGEREVAFLGVIIEEKSSWKPHINSTKIRTSKAIVIKD